MNTYNYAGIDAFDINNGKGFGVTLFVQGCPHHCDGCHNPETWDFNGGKRADMRLLDILDGLFRDPNIVRFTISGGEPFANLALSISAACLFAHIKPDRPIWVYTGYLYEELGSISGAEDLLECCDVLVDGPFQLKRRDLSLPFRGSSNQRIIDMKKTRETGTVTLLEC